MEAPLGGSSGRLLVQHPVRGPDQGLMADGHRYTRASGSNGVCRFESEYVHSTCMSVQHQVHNSNGGRQLHVLATTPSACVHYDNCMFTECGSPHQGNVNCTYNNKHPFVYTGYVCPACTVQPDRQANSIGKHHLVACCYLHTSTHSV